MARVADASSLLTDDFQLSSSFESLQSLPLQALCAVFPFLSARDYLALTSLCQRFAALRVSPALLLQWGLRPLDPVHSPLLEFPRRGVIECMRAKHLESLTCRSLHYDVAVGSSVVAWGAIDSHLFLFSHQEGHLVMWEAVGERQVVYWRVDCGPKLHCVEVGTGKVGYITSSAIVVLTLQRETKAEPAVHDFKTNDCVAAGSIHFFDAQRLVLARLNSWVYVLTEDLLPQRVFCEVNLILVPRCVVPVHRSLPYIWLIGVTKVLAYDITKAAKTPIYSFSVPVLLSPKAESVFVKSAQQSRCYLVLLNTKEEQTGDLYVNSRLLSHFISDFSICEDALFAYTELSSTLYQYAVSVSGVQLLRSIALSERLHKPQLLSFEYRLIAIDHGNAVKVFDYSGSLFHSYCLEDFQASRAARVGEVAVLVGESRCTGLAAALVLHYWREGADPRVEVIARNLKERQKDPRRDKAAMKKHELYLWERMQRRKAKVAKRERKAAHLSRRWKSSIKQSLAAADLELDEFDML